MPYITKERRKNIASGLREAAGAVENPGDLNYAFTLLAKLYLAREALSYQRLNDVLGAFEGAKQELYRRVAAPYEDEKRDQNGEVE